jgi:hypothetical protein
MEAINDSVDTISFFDMKFWVNLMDFLNFQSVYPSN